MDTAAALRYNYRQARPSIDTSDEDDWYKCGSKHVRGLTRQGNVLEEGYASQPFLASWDAAGFTKDEAKGIFFQIRLFDFDKGAGNNGGEEASYHEEITLFSDGGNMLYWQYPPERAICGGDPNSVGVKAGDDILVVAVDSDGKEIVAVPDRLEECQSIHESISNMFASRCDGGTACTFTRNSPLNSMQLAQEARSSGYPRLDYFSLAFCTNTAAWDAFLNSGETDLAPLLSPDTTFGVKFTALLAGGASNNPRQYEFNPNDGDRYCESAKRAVDVFYTLSQGYIRATLAAGYTGNDEVSQGRNVFFGGSSQAEVCVEADESATLCRYQSDCTGGYFCAESCISGLCGLPPLWEQYLGKPYAEGGYGVCQGCSDCVHDDEIYDAETDQAASELTCTRTCQDHDPPASITVEAFHRRVDVGIRGTWYL